MQIASVLIIINLVSLYPVYRACNLVARRDNNNK